MTRVIVDKNIEFLVDGEESYEPSSTHVDYTLVNRLVEEFSAAVNGGDDIEQYYLEGHLRASLRSAKNLDGQGVIDAVILTLEKDDDRSILYCADYLLGSLISVLHTKGITNLVVDYSTIPRIRSVGRRLLGEEESKLVVGYIFSDIEGHSIRFVGGGLENCDVTIQGNVWSLGADANNCSFITNSLPMFFGKKSRNCAFHFGYNGEHDSYHLGKDPDQCGYVLSTSEDSGWGRELSESWFDDGNSIHVPNGKGDWKELTP